MLPENTIDRKNSPHLDRLAEFIAETKFADLDQKTVEQTIKMLFDTVGVQIRGSREPEVTNFINSLPKCADQIASVISAGFPKTDYLWATMANGTEGIFMELDEGHRPTGHPGIHIIPAAVAMAEKLQASGENLILAVVLGYEVAARISNGAKLKAEIHPHGHMGTVGSAAACAKLLGFNKDQIKEAMNAAASLPIATSFGACYEGATIRNAFTGVSNIIGILCAQLVGSGFTGLDTGVEYTFGSLIGKSFDTACLTNNLGENFQVNTNYFKFHACCAMNHPVLDALQQIQKESKSLKPESIVKINVFVTEYSLGVAKYPVRNQLSAKFSIPFAVATTIIHGRATTEAFQNDQTARPDIDAIARKVVLIGSPELTSRWPAEVSADIKIELIDGTVLEGHCKNAFGYWDNPCTTEDLIEKFSDMTKAVFKDGQAPKIYDHFTKLPQYKSVAAFMDDLRKF